MKIDHWVRQLSNLPAHPSSEHLYRVDQDAGTLRLSNLCNYLKLVAAKEPTVLIVGEAPGYRGTKRTGVPFASEKIVSGRGFGATLFTEATDFKKISNDSIYVGESTSTIMWRTIDKCQAMPLLWAAYPHHPHNPGKAESNRAPTRAEILSGQPLILELIKLFGIKQVVAVGNVAYMSLRSLGIESKKIRHPSRGGAAIFERQMMEVLWRR